MKTLFIFRRDLRTFDNTALNRVVEKYPKTEIIPIFIFNKKQIEETDNKYYSKNAVQFLFESLDEISDFTNFFYTSTNDIPILETLFHKYKFDNLAFNIDYTPYAIKSIVNTVFAA
jgi:deoxyribodipyrimidine photo-lyase